MQLVGPLPGELASMTLFTAAVGQESKAADAARVFIDFLTGTQAAPRFKAGHGLSAGMSMDPIRRNILATSASN